MRDKPWPGLRHDASDVGEESWSQLHNVQMRVVGELRDRPGLGARYTLSASLLTFLETGSVQTLIGFRSGNIKAIDIATGSTYTNKTGLSSTVGCFASCLGAIYYCNGVDAMQVIYNGSLTAQTAGITAPASAPTAGATGGGTVDAGVHLIRFRWKNSVTGYLSNPSPALSYTAAGGANIPLTLGTTADAKVDKMVIEMTQAAGSTFYVVATVANASSYTISISDVLLALNQLSNVFASPDGYGHEPPPLLIAIVEHRNRLFGIAADGTLYWTRAGFPEAWNVLNWGKKVFAAGGDKPVAMASFYNDLYIFGSRGMARLVYNADPASGMLVQIPAALGVHSQRCVTMAEGVIYGFGRTGLWSISAMQPDYISDPIQTDLNNADLTHADIFHTFFDPDERVVWFMYRATSDASVSSAVVYDLSTQTWTTRGFRHGIVASCTTSSSTTTGQAYLADSNIYCWRLDDGVWDGVPASMTSGVVTATAGSTTSVLNVSQSLDTSQSLAGAILYSEIGDESHVITSNTAGTITLTTPLSISPAVGQEYYVGSIEYIHESGWIPEAMDRDGVRPNYLELRHASVPTSQGVILGIIYFFDYSATPFVFTKNANDSELSGVTIIDSYPAALCQLDLGINRVPMPSDWSIVCKWMIRRTRPEGRLRLVDAGVAQAVDRKAKQVAR